MTEKIKIELPFQPLDWLLEGIAFLSFIGLLLIPFLSYGDLPDTVPIHFNASGEADDYGSKASIWILPAIVAFTYLTIIILSRFPQNLNYPVKVHDGNRSYQYRLGTRLLRVMNGAMNIMFLYIMFQIIQGAQSKEVQLGWGFLVALLVGLGLIIGLYIYLAKRQP